jgi:endonuclease YncB( thermonuclease family)
MLVVACLVLGCLQVEAGQTPAATFGVSAVYMSLGTLVVIAPDAEAVRRYPITTARLYGVAELPADDPYRRAVHAELRRLTAFRPVTAQIWKNGSGRSLARLYAFEANRWQDVNARLVADGVMLSRTEAGQTPYGREAAFARELKTGTYAFRRLSWFWANSTPLYARTLSPVSGLELPFAIAAVHPARCEAGYLVGREVALLPTGEQKLQSHVVNVAAAGPELTITMVPVIGARFVTVVWRWDGAAYRLHSFR